MQMRYAPQINFLIIDTSDAISRMQLKIERFRPKLVWMD